MWRALSLLVIAAGLAAAQDSSPPYQVERVMGNFGYAGGVVWAHDHLLIADVPAGKIQRIDSEGPSLYREGLHASGMGVDGDGRLYLCDSHEHRIVRVDPSKKGREDVLVDKVEGKRLNGPAGVAVSKNNHLWFTDGAFASADREKAIERYGVYHVTPKGEVSLMASTAGRANGIALAQDGKTLYVVDSDARSVIAWDLDRSGAASNRRVLLKVREGVPNGIAAGLDGKLYVAAKGVEVYDRGGKFEMLIELSEKPGDLTFGDGEHMNLYVAARTSLYRVRFNAAAVKGKGGKSN